MEEGISEESNIKLKYVNSISCSSKQNIDYSTSLRHRVMGTLCAKFSYSMRSTLV